VNETTDNRVNRLVTGYPWGYLAGRAFSGESLLGKPAVLWFWTPWCPQCQREPPEVGRVAAANPAVAFAGVPGHDQIPAMQAFVDDYRLGRFTQLADTGGTVWAKFGVTQQPAFAFVDSHGGIDVVKGSLPESQLTERVHALAGR
jgi:thiol-disulfide isomerase/thioredoxin